MDVLGGAVLARPVTVFEVLEPDLNSCSLTVSCVDEDVMGQPLDSESCFLLQLPSFPALINSIPLERQAQANLFLFMFLLPRYFITATEK